ncbi:MAG TPA: BrnT family toxin [Stellaceae bacterium]|nr:BrnT family toxin [Stellaceae bacterium]
MDLRWTWDPEKAATNLRKHKVSFELAARALDDVSALTQPDPYPAEERWQTLGKPSAGSYVVLFVVHTASPDPDEEGNEAVGRIITARKAEPRERKAYEEG